MANDARCMTTKHVKRSALLRTIRTVDVVLAARKNQVTNGRQRACFYCGGGDDVVAWVDDEEKEEGEERGTKISSAANLAMVLRCLLLLVFTFKPT